MSAFQVDVGRVLSPLSNLLIATSAIRAGGRLPVGREEAGIISQLEGRCTSNGQVFEGVVSSN